LAFICFIDFVLDLVTLDDIYGFILGTQDSAKWNPGTDLDELPSVSYSHKEQEEKHDIVQLVCSTDGINRFQVLGESPTNTYTFRLTHKCASVSSQLSLFFSSFY
jgi:hypothetical protein